MLYNIEPHQVENSNKCCLLLFVNSSKQPDSYIHHFTSHKPVVVTPNDKCCFSRRFPFRPYMFPTQTFEYRQLSVLVPMFGSSFKSNFGGKNVAHVCFLKCLEGRWFPEF